MRPQRPSNKITTVKGYEYTKGQYVIIEAVRDRQPARCLPSTPSRSSSSVNLDEVPPEYLEKPYFVVPENDIQAEAFAVVRAALAKSKKAGLRQDRIRWTRWHIIAINAAPGDEPGMMAYTMVRCPGRASQACGIFQRTSKKVMVDEDSLELAETPHQTKRQVRPIQVRRRL